MTREGGTLVERTKARAELEEFAMATYNALVNDRPDSSIRIMCRLDVGVMMNSNNHLEYFVNELEQGCTMSLFGVISDGNFLPHRLGDETKGLLVTWLDNYYKST